MRARLVNFWSLVGETFWVVPAAIVLACGLAAIALLGVDRADVLPAWLIASPLVYSGTATGARTLLGAVASSTIGVAGTVFSITIAALTLAAGQMGPRLLRNFTRDRGNQVVLGIFLGTFTYALLILRAVRDDESAAFTPHASLSFGVLLAFVCVAMLVYFVEHIAGRINVDVVVDLVSEEVFSAVRRLTRDEPSPPAGHLNFAGGETVCDPRRGYLQTLDEDHLADWAQAKGVVVHLLVRPGDFVFPGAPIAVVVPPTEGAQAAVRAATALGSRRLSAQDLEFAVRQLVEVAVRALSPGINDPHTAMSVLVRFGAVLCDLAPRHLVNGATRRDGRVVLVRPAPTYDGLTDAMLHMIRQNAAGSTAVLATGLDVLIAAAAVERRPERLATLARHADLWLADARRDIAAPADLADVEARHRDFGLMRIDGPLPRAWRDT